MNLKFALFAVLLFALGVGLLKWPRKFWYLGHGWWAYDNPDEVRLSDGYMLLNFVNAIAAFLLGIGTALFAIFGN